MRRLTVGLALWSSIGFAQEAEEATEQVVDCEKTPEAAECLETDSPAPAPAAQPVAEEPAPLTQPVMVEPAPVDPVPTETVEELEDLEVVTVSSSLRDEELALNQPVSISVVTEESIRDEEAVQFEDVLYYVPNLNWSGATSRPKYFQIRGIGEQEDYQGAPNASVGFLVDDIDLSGLGMAATMFDVAQVEVLKGPQGTRYGANALAGLIYVKSNEPTPTFEAGSVLSVGTDNLFTAGAYASGPLDKGKRLMFRMSLQQHMQDGYRENTFLGRTDTNGRDEFGGKFKLKWLAAPWARVELTAIHANMNNGYDAWTLDNNGFETLTDQPGVDNQKTTGGALKLNFFAKDVAQFTSLTTVADTQHRHAYDGDWANPEFWASKTCENWETGAEEPCQYDYTWDKRARRLMVSQELRIASGEGGRIFADTTEWLAGFYLLHNDENNDLGSDYNGFPDVYLTSEYRATNLAGFAELNSHLGPVDVSVGARVENRMSAYSDSDGEEFSPSETMWGGHITVMGHLSDQSRLYARVARGYKAGGFNMGLPENLEQFKTFGAEALYNYEIGYKGNYYGGRLNSTISAFFMDRQNQQVEGSVQDPDNPQRFFLYTTNAARAFSFGGEVEISGRPTDFLTLRGSLGLLQATYRDYAFDDGSGETEDLSGREVAHAPSYTFMVAATYQAPIGVYAHLSVTGMDRFYYSDSADFQSDPYAKMNARVGYNKDGLGVFVWCRNLLDARYGVRGFYFGNDPSQGWTDTGYIRYGDPRQFGVSVRADF